MTKPRSALVCDELQLQEVGRNALPVSGSKRRKRSCQLGALGRAALQHNRLGQADADVRAWSLESVLSAMSP